MAPRTFWTRRSFLQTVGHVSAVGAIRSMVPRASAAMIGEHDAASASRFAYVSTDDAIHVFGISDLGAWTKIQTVSSLAPSHLALSSDQNFLYVANAVDSFEHRPTGSVEAYSVDGETGCMALLNRCGLALSATLPRHVAVSPNGRQLVVTAEGGSSYNLLPLRQDGSIGRVTASLKQIGRGFDPVTQSQSMPHSVVFASDGSVIATDVGCDRVSSLSLGEEGSLSLKKHRSAARGSGPGKMVAHPAVCIIFVAGILDPVVSSVRIGVASNASLTIVNALRLSSADGGISGLAIHPTGQVLFAADATTIRSVLVDDTGRLEEATIIQRTDGIIDLAVSRDGAYLFGLTNTGAVTRLAIESRLSGLRRPVEVASVSRPTSMALKHC